MTAFADECARLVLSVAGIQLAGCGTDRSTRWWMNLPIEQCRELVSYAKWHAKRQGWSLNGGKP